MDQGSFAVNHGGTPIPEPDLRRMVKGLDRIFASNDTANAINTLAHGLFATLETNGLPGSHQAAALNLLCQVVDKCSKSSLDDLQSLLWQGNLWQRSFDTFLTQHQAGKPKVLRQLLSTLASALNDATREDSISALKTKVANQLLGILIGANEQSFVKPAMQATALFISKDALQINDLARKHDILHGNDTPNSESPIAEIQDLLRSLLKWVARGDHGSSVAILISILTNREKGYVRHQAEGGLVAQSLWVEPLVDAISNDLETLPAYRTYIFPVLFEHHVADFRQFLAHLGLTQHLASHAETTDDRKYDPSSAAILFAALQTGKEMGFVQDGTDDGDKNVLYLPTRWIEGLLVRAERSTRLAGLSLLIASYSMTKPVPRATFRLMQRHLHHFHADTDSNFRGEVFSLMQRFMDRLRAATAGLSKKLLNSNSNQVRTSPLDLGRSEVKVREILEQQKAFTHWYVRFMSWELRPTASYQRHISALRCLQIVVKSGIDCNVPTKHWSKSALGQTKWPFAICILDAALQRQLLDLVVDPFDDVRQAAAALLSLSSTVNDVSTATVLTALDRAEKVMLASGRADQADGVAHLYVVLAMQCNSGQSVGGSWWATLLDISERLVIKMEEMISIAKRDHAAAVGEYPLHGLFISMRYVLTETSIYNQYLRGQDESRWRLLHQRLIISFQNVWDIVHDILCNDAPEGYLPDDMADSDEISTKDALSYAWRALKESSSLMGWIIAKAPLAGDVAVLKEQDLQTITSLAFVQLVELRHRGAFSTVAQTFAACCQRLNDPELTSGSELLRSWYEKFLQCVQRKSTINTRRSAGLPSLICGILAADRPGLLFSTAIKGLSVVASTPADIKSAESGGLPQVHALNCLKDIFKNTKLGERSRSYVPRALDLAAGCLESQIWAIRNCGLMLFRALVDRLLGTNDSYIDDGELRTSRLSLAQHPRLLAIIMRLLAEDRTVTQVASEGVFLALQLLQRASVPDECRLALLEAVHPLVASKSWHVRDKAARSYVKLHAHDARVQSLATLLATSPQDPNALHGALLSAKYLIRLLIASGSPAGTKVNGIHRSLHLALSESAQLYKSNACSITKAAFVDLICEYPLQTLLYALPISIHSELAAVIYGPGAKRIGVGVLRKALARFLPRELAQLPLHEVEAYKIILLVTDLVSLDADACCSYLQTSKECLKDGRQSSFARLTFRISTDLLLRRFDDGAVKAAAADVLLQLLDADVTPAMYLQETQDLVGRFSAMYRVQPIQDSPAYADRWIQLEAALLEHRFMFRKQFDNSLISDLAAWVDDANMAAEGIAIWSCEAAAEALSRYRHVWHSMADTRSPQLPYLRLCMLTYDFLNDDDEKIRELASATACRVLTASGSISAGHGLVPLVAGEKLAAMMVRRWSGSRDLACEALFRAFGSRSTSLKDRIAEAEKTTTALFAEEKQNLYIDEAREVRLWSRIILRLAPKALSKHDLITLALWSTDGLAYMTAKADAQADNALGWTTRPEVFTTGLQVILAAQVLLALRRRGKQVGVRISQIHKMLFELSAAGERCGMNGLWSIGIDKALRDSVLLKIGAVWQVLSSIAPAG